MRVLIPEAHSTSHTKNCCFAQLERFVSFWPMHCYSIHTGPGLEDWNKMLYCSNIDSLFEFKQIRLIRHLIYNGISIDFGLDLVGPSIQPEMRIRPNHFFRVLTLSSSNVISHQGICLRKGLIVMCSHLLQQRWKHLTETRWQKANVECCWFELMLISNCGRVAL